MGEMTGCAENNDTGFVKGLCREDGCRQMSGWDELEKCSAKEDGGLTGRGEDVVSCYFKHTCFIWLSCVLASYLVF